MLKLRESRDPSGVVQPVRPIAYSIPFSCSGWISKRKDGKVVDGEEIFGEVMKGEIKSGGFDLNGSWSPLYTVHKLFAGLLDVHGAWGNKKALTVVEGLGGYFERVFAALTPAQVQEVLGCEYGGLNESYAEMHQRTGNPRWLKMAETLYGIADRTGSEQIRLEAMRAEGVWRIVNILERAGVPGTVFANALSAELYHLEFLTSAGGSSGTCR